MLYIAINVIYNSYYCLYRAMWFKLHLLVMQVAFIRPCLMFIAAVLWVDGAYTPGLVRFYLKHIYP